MHPRLVTTPFFTVRTFAVLRSIDLMRQQEPREPSR